MGIFPLRPKEKRAFLDRGMPLFFFHSLNVYPVRNDARWNF
jgi:hypothetical protein